jgi:hypothetical protein
MSPDSDRVMWKHGVSQRMRVASRCALINVRLILQSSRRPISWLRRTRSRAKLGARVQHAPVVEQDGLAFVKTARSTSCVRARLRRLRRMRPWKAQVRGNSVRGGRARLEQRLARRQGHAARARARVTRPPEHERYRRAVELERASAEAGPARGRRGAHRPGGRWTTRSGARAVTPAISSNSPARMVYVPKRSNSLHDSTLDAIHIPLYQRMYTLLACRSEHRLTLLAAGSPCAEHRWALARARSNQG